MFAMEAALIRISRGAARGCLCLKGFPIRPSLSNFSLRQKLKNPFCHQKAPMKLRSHCMTVFLDRATNRIHILEAQKPKLLTMLACGELVISSLVRGNQILRLAADNQLSAPFTAIRAVPGGHFVVFERAR